MSHFYESLHPQDTDPRHQGEPINLDVDEPAEDEGEPEPDYDYVPFEKTSTYRDQMEDAGRGHLV